MTLVMCFRWKALTKVKIKVSETVNSEEFGFLTEGSFWFEIALFYFQGSTTFEGMKEASRLSR